MRQRKLAAALAMAAGLALGASAASAQTVSYSFGDLLEPGQTEGPSTDAIWGNLSISTGASFSYTFLLSLSDNFSSIFGSDAYVAQAIFNTPSGQDPVAAAISTGSWGVSNVTLVTSAPNVGGLGFDFGDCFGTGDNCNHGNSGLRLTAGESVEWTLTFSSSQGSPMLFGDPAAALKVQAIGASGEGSAWYGVTTPIPEPETYAMLLAGLALLGFAMRRRETLTAAQAA